MGSFPQGVVGDLTVGLFRNWERETEMSEGGKKKKKEKSTVAVFRFIKAQ